MRRIVSILLLAVFGLPYAGPMLALGQRAKAGVPACCRHDGKHRCLVSMDEHGKLVSLGPQFGASSEKCPYNPGSLAPAQPNLLAGPTAAATFYDSLVNHPTGVAQTEAKRRISRYRCYQKRGPPTLSML